MTTARSLDLIEAGVIHVEIDPETLELVSASMEKL